MNPVFFAFGRALRTLIQPAMLWRLLWPVLAAFVFWSAALALFWGQAHGALAAWLRSIGWLANWMGGGVDPLAGGIVSVLLLILLLPLTLGTALLVITAWVLPEAATLVARRDYPELERRGAGSFAGALANGLVAAGGFVLGWLVTLPLWLIPGLGAMLTLLLGAWANQRGYRYDALAGHADKTEFRAFVQGERRGLYLLGILTGLLAFVPLANLLAPAITGLAFIHFCLEGLRRQRQAAVRA